jgi:hypothetical protein
MSAHWPTNWQGQTHLDCGAEGPILTLVCTPSQPSGIHQKSFQSIAHHWRTIWPEFRRNITDLMERYKQDPPDWANVRTLYVELSDEPLAEGAEWSIGVVFSTTETMWVLPFRGLVPVRDEARAIW